jgi:hypothetical protein
MENQALKLASAMEQLFELEAYQSQGQASLSVEVLSLERSLLNSSSPLAVMVSHNDSSEGFDETTLPHLES